ncbi:MAG: uroporphyrinogen decarboxylase family protein [SAR324 cluster bacterium]|nr:uroporphyrinogen decarboxylase family protein [SAR324 cluster bacterium]
MTENTMTSMQRVLTTLGHQEPDRVPLFLLLTMHGAQELGISIKDYFSNPEHVAEGQMRLLEKYRHDCIYSFFYAPIEVEAFGADVLYVEDGPPNSSLPLIRKHDDIKRLKPPNAKESPCLIKVYEATRMIKSKVENEVPIIGVVMSPFSLPVMQMGFDKYIDLLYEQPDLFQQLMAVNEDFCVQWANAQLEAGATAICYFDPVSSPTIIPREMYLKTGFEVAKRTISQIKGPTATHMASGFTLSILDDVAQTGTAVIGSSTQEDLSALKAASQGKLTILGNLNGIEMRRWTEDQAEAAVREAIAKAGPGGGFILSDNHGEIPWQVPENVLAAISNAVRKWGQYPLDWIEDYGK